MSAWVQDTLVLHGDRSELPGDLAPLPCAPSRQAALRRARWVDERLLGRVCASARPGQVRAATADRLARLALAAADAVARTRPHPERCGLVLGTACGAHLCNERFYESLRRGQPAPRLFSLTLASAAASAVALHLDLQGPVLTLAQGATAGLAALGLAAQWLEQGRLDWALVIAADTPSATLCAALEPEIVSEQAVAVVLTREPAQTRVASHAGGFGPRGAERARAEALRRAELHADECTQLVLEPTLAADALRAVVSRTPPLLAVARALDVVDAVCLRGSLDGAAR